jgi:hypothetical protein
MLALARVSGQTAQIIAAFYNTIRHKQTFSSSQNIEKHMGANTVRSTRGT